MSVPGNFLDDQGGGRASQGQKLAARGAATGTGRGGFDPLAIKAAGADQRMGYDMLMQYLKGTTDQGTGPFAGFLEKFFAPIATAAINALSFGNGGLQGNAPTSLDDLFASIQSGIGGGATTNIYDTLSGLADQGMQGALGGNMSFDELENVISLMSPLKTAGMTGVGESAFRRQQGDTLRGEQAKSYWDMNEQDKRKDWGTFFTDSPFYQQNYGR